MLPLRHRRIAFALAALASRGLAVAADAVPANVVVEARVIEARSTTPDFKAMEELSFFINTDGTGVSEDQWLATIARQAPDSFLATLAFETLPVSASISELRLDNRSRSVRLSLNLSEFVADGVFNATVNGALERGDEIERSFERSIELRVGQTFVWCSRELELSGTEYLSHFREYRDRDHRAELYDKLREFTTFLIVAYTVRVADEPEASAQPQTLELPTSVEIPELESMLGIETVGSIELELVIDPVGAPSSVKIARSSIPELNSQILAEAATWSFPDAAGQKGRLTLELEAKR